MVPCPPEGISCRHRQDSRAIGRGQRREDAHEPHRLKERVKRMVGRVRTRALGGANAAGQAVAWQTPHQWALVLDPIIPRNQCSSDDLSNLQALCFRRNAGKRWEAGCVFSALEDSGRVLLENAFEAVQRRCRSGNAWPQTGDPAAASIRWVGVAPAGMECGGGAASPHSP